MKRPEESPRQWFDEHATFYDDFNLREDSEHYVALRYVSSFIAAHGISSILDVGCGTGRAVKYFLDKHPSVRVHGIEPARGMIHQAVSKHAIAAELLTCGVGESLPFANESFDAVCEFGCLHHVSRPNVIVSEMLRVARKAVFLSDSNRFGQGSMPARLAKLALYKVGLWGTANWLKTRGKGYTFGDAIQYSYSVYDSFHLLARWADRVIFIPTRKEKAVSWFHPLLTAGHILACAIRDER